MEQEIVNKVAASGIVTINLEDFLSREETAVFDLKDYLFMGLILKEKDFRAALQTVNWQQYENKNAAITCTADAIIPIWAYMLVASYLQPYAKEIGFGDSKKLEQTILQKNIAAINANDYAGKRVVIKGCGDVQVPESAYIAITQKLRPAVKSIMYGEPCSTVPIYKKQELK